MIGSPQTDDPRHQDGAGDLFTFFIGNSDFYKGKKEQETIERMLDKFVHGNDDKATKI